MDPVVIASAQRQKCVVVLVTEVAVVEVVEVDRACAADDASGVGAWSRLCC